MPTAAWLAVAGLAFLALQLPLRNYIVDDAYIHLTFARNLAAGEGFSFNPGEPTYGVTAPLWTLLLALVGSLVGFTPALAKILSILFSVLTIPMVHRLSGAMGLSRKGSLCVALIWAVEVWLVRWTAAGMETSLALLLLLLAFDAQLELRARAGFFLGLAALCRPETAPLAVIFALDTAREAGWRRGLAVLAITLAVVAPWLIYAALEFGAVIPNPARVKGLGLPPPGDLIMGLKRTAAIIGGAHLVELSVIGLGVFGVFGRLVKAGADIARKLGLLLVWALFPPVVLLAQDVIISSRYLLLGLPPLTLAAFLMLETESQNGTGFHLRRYTGVLTALIIALQLSLTLLITLPHVRAFGSTSAALQQLADYLRNKTPAGASVAVGDVGIIGYSSGRKVIDLEGLVSPAIIPHRLQGQYDSLIVKNYFLKAAHPDYLIDRSRVPERLRGQVGAAYHPLLTIPVKGGRVDTAAEEWYYTLYALTDTVGGYHRMNE